MNKTNLLFLGTTNYGFELSKSDENKFRYTKDELNWCKENEEYIWRFIVDEKLLYNKYY